MKMLLQLRLTLFFFLCYSVISNADTETLNDDQPRLSGQVKTSLRSAGAQYEEVGLDVTDMSEDTFTIEDPFSDEIAFNDVETTTHHRIAEVYNLNVSTWKGPDREHAL